MAHLPQWLPTHRGRWQCTPQRQAEMTPHQLPLYSSHNHGFSWKMGGVSPIWLFSFHLGLIFHEKPMIMGGKGKWYELVYINFSINFECHEFFKDVFCYTICWYIIMAYLRHQQLPQTELPGPSWSLGTAPGHDFTHENPGSVTIESIGIHYFTVHQFLVFFSWIAPSNPLGCNWFV